MKRRYAKLIRRCLLLLMYAGAVQCTAQCNNWSISAGLVTSATCASNGSFRVLLHGPDTANLSSLQFGVPLTNDSLSVPLHASRDFQFIPPGTYQVSAVGYCNGQLVGRSTTVTVPGKYIAPSVHQFDQKNSLSCAPTGYVSISVDNGVQPMTFMLTAYPATYTGPTTQTLNQSGAIFTDLPPGVYTIQVADACRSGTVPVSGLVSTLSPAAALFDAYPPQALGCDTVLIAAPGIDQNSGGWNRYASDTDFKFSAQISGISGRTPVTRMDGTSVAMKLPAGMRLKDLAVTDNSGYIVQLQLASQWKHDPSAIFTRASRHPHGHLYRRSLEWRLRGVRFGDNKRTAGTIRHHVAGRKHHHLPGQPGNAHRQ